MKAVENIGEKKDYDVPVSKCPSDLKKEKEEVEKVADEKKSKALVVQAEAIQAAKQVEYEAKEAITEKKVEVEKKTQETAAAYNDQIEGGKRVLEEKVSAERAAAPASDPSMSSDEAWTVNELGHSFTQKNANSTKKANSTTKANSTAKADAKKPEATKAEVKPVEAKKPEAKPEAKPAAVEVKKTEEQKPIAVVQ